MQGIYTSKTIPGRIRKASKTGYNSTYRGDETSEWCNSFVLVPKANGKVRLYLDLVNINQVLIRPIHRGPTLNDILPKLNNAKYLSLIDVSSEYHNLKLDEKSSYFMMFVCQFGRYRYKHVPFRAAPAGDMFQRKIDEIYKDMPNVFGIADDILVAGYEADGRDHEETVQTVLQRCRQVNLKLNEDKYHFRCTSVPFFWEIISQNGVQPDPQKIKALVEMPLPKIKRNSRLTLVLIIIWVNFLLALQAYVTHFKSLHQAEQYGHGMHNIRSCMTKQSH